MADKISNFKVSKRLKNTIICIIMYIVNLALMGSLIYGNHSLYEYRNDLCEKIEISQRELMKSDISGFKAILNQDIYNGLVKVETSADVSDWFKNNPTKINKSKNVEFLYLFDVTSKQVIVSDVKTPVTLESLTIQSDAHQEEYTFNTLMRSYKDSMTSDRYYTIIDGTKYWIEWSYSPTPTYGYHGGKYEINGITDETETGIIIVTFMNSGNVYDSFQANLFDTENQTLFIFNIVTIASIIASFVIMTILVHKQRVHEVEGKTN